MSSHLYPITDRMLPREAKESLLEQRGGVVWLYGLSGSGKSTIALQLERQLHDEGKLVKLLDGDNIRTGLNKNLGFSDEDRAENIRRIAEVAKLFVDSGMLVLASFITPTNALRHQAREIIGSDDLLEVYVQASYETCAERDPKGLYQKVKDGQVAQFTGKDSSFEEPTQADLTLATESLSVEEACAQLHMAIGQHFQK